MVDTYDIRYEAICIISVGGVFMNHKVGVANCAENHLQFCSGPATSNHESYGLKLCRCEMREFVLGEIPGYRHILQSIFSTKKSAAYTHNLVVVGRQGCPGCYQKSIFELTSNYVKYPFKEDSEKSRFFSSLSSQLDTCPDIVAR